MVVGAAFADKKESRPDVVVVLNRDILEHNVGKSNSIKNEWFYCIKAEKNKRKSMLMNSNFGNRFPDIISNFFYLEFKPEP